MTDTDILDICLIKGPHTNLASIIKDLVGGVTTGAIVNLSISFLIGFGLAKLIGPELANLLQTTTD